MDVSLKRSRPCLLANVKQNCENDPKRCLGKHLIYSKMQLCISDVIACMFVCIVYCMTFPSSWNFFS